MNTTSTPALSAGSASLPITTSGVVAGLAGQPYPPGSPALAAVAASGEFPVYGLVADGTKAGAFLTQTQDFVGAWVLTRHTSGMQGDVPVQQIVMRGDQSLLMFCGAGPLINLTACDALTLTVTNCRSGSVTLTMAL